MIGQLASLKEWVPVVVIMGGFAEIAPLMLAPIRVELQGIKDRLAHVDDMLKILPNRHVERRYCGAGVPVYMILWLCERSLRRLNGKENRLSLWLTLQYREPTLQRTRWGP